MRGPDGLAYGELQIILGLLDVSALQRNSSKRSLKTGAVLKGQVKNAHVVGSRGDSKGQVKNVHVIDSQ